MNYGIPYMGSKSKIAADIIRLLPEAGHFYDLFAGGCAVTHAAMLSGKFGHIHANDIDTRPVALFRNVMDGKYADEKRWISREDFYRLKDTDPYVSCCWSFGNGGVNYLYCREVEDWKHALFLARVQGDTSMLADMGIRSDGSRRDISAHHEEYKRKYIKWWLERHGEECAGIDELCSNLCRSIKDESEKLRNYLLDALKESGLTQAEVGMRLGTCMHRHYFGTSQWSFPTKEHYNKMRQFMPLPVPYMEIIGLQRFLESLQSLQRLQRLQSLQSLQRLQSLQSLQRLQSLERLQRLQRLQRQQRILGLGGEGRLEISSMDYREVRVKPGGIIYADPPYKGTTGYSCGAFDHEAFYDWCAARKGHVFISEYWMPEDRFEAVWEKDVLCTFSSTNNKRRVTEKIFVPK